MSKNKYLLSIVVPTHNRSQYAIACVQSLLEIPSEQLQVVVHDTSTDSARLAQWAASQNDSRLRYVHWHERLSMTDNHERALSLAEGEYVCLIGDDDSVSAQIIRVAEFASRKGINCLTPQVKAMYSWPDFRTRLLGSAHAGRLYLDSFDGTLQRLETSTGLASTLAAACQGTDALPKLYHGLVRRDILDQLRMKQGRVFLGTSPDMSAAIGLALICKEYYLVDLPFTMPGASGGSNTGRSAVNKHKGDLSKDAHMQPFKDLQWPAVLPRFFSVETVWAHAAWETLNVSASLEQRREFSLSRLYALCLFKHWDYRKETFVAIKLAREKSFPGLSGWNLFLDYLACVSNFIVSKARRLCKPNVSNGREVLGVVEDVCVARRLLDERLGKSEQFDRSLEGA
ncbi:MAG: glycosyltransferase [Pseudomonas sp.]|uniref:glycosyltransferase family 2 protein n=1 Tax=Ectopseudomonas guguanensis TaxID=1198456 RepID=UPI0012D6351C|nr:MULTISPECIES: glycosyltransferase [Pseudomonas]MPT21134.1 glycosyltransferase [Pseudomonas sp.]WJH56529.1 glycosyltransferase family 2 protein [Pseudomonas guguanensis]